VIDLATLFAGPVIASIMADFGADVIKVEHPRGDALRTLGWSKDDVPLWWSLVARNKRCITLNLAHAGGQEILRQLVASADVVVENFRPGTLERWNVGPDELQKLNPGLVIVRTTAFGQTGPYSARPGFGTLAEAMSGFAHSNGWPDGPPTLPPFALADGVAALTGTFAAMFALWWRQHGGRGAGQVVDLSIYEPLFWLLGPQLSVFDQLGIVQGRTGNAAPFTAPRNVYRTREGRWVALSASTQSIAERVMNVIGRPDLTQADWFRSHAGRVAHADVLDDAIQRWIGEHTLEATVAEFARHEAAIAPIYSIKDITEDPQFLARETFVTVEHPTLGPLRMQNIITRLSRTPGRVDFPGPELGEHNEEIFGGELRLTDEQLAELRAAQTI
jgi:crotonobetainyl-CoA:carnitine CoA-transferase CaiB-like acyl-CoA transferase